MIFDRLLRVALWASIIFLFVSCASLQSRARAIETIDGLVIQQRYPEAVESLEQTQQTLYRDNDEVLYYLDSGVLRHYAGDYRTSNEMLSEAERLIEEYQAISVTGAAGSLLINDTVLDYSGEDYEDIYINIFKALNYIHLDEQDKAFVEVRRVDQKLSVLEDRYTKLADEMGGTDKSQLEYQAGKNRFYTSALARYLSFLMYREDMEFDEAAVDLEKIADAYRLQTDAYPFPQPSLEIEPDRFETLDVIGFVGRSPIKLGATLRIRTEKNRIIILRSNEAESSQTFRAMATVLYWPGIEEGLYFKFQLPYLVKRESSVDRVTVRIDNSSPVALSPFESVEDIARITYEVKEPLIYLKTITRTVVKGIVAEQAKRQMRERAADRRTSSLLAFVGSIAADVAVDATEVADLRLSRYFPGTAHILSLEVEPGRHTVEISYFAKDGTLLYTDLREDYIVRRGELNLLETVYLR